MSCTEAKAEANRRNAQHSTGPTSPEGKARVARNAIRHGLLSGEAVMEWEDADAYRDFRAAMYSDLRPRGAMEQVLADTLVAQTWRLRRLIRMEGYLYDRDGRRAREVERRERLEASRPDPDFLHPAAIGQSLHESLGSHHSAYETLRRYERTITTVLHTALGDLRDRQKRREERGEGDREGDCTSASSAEGLSPSLDHGDSPRQTTPGHGDSPPPRRGTVPVASVPGVGGPMAMFGKAPAEDPEWDAGKIVRRVFYGPPADEAGGADAAPSARRGEETRPEASSVAATSAVASGPAAPEEGSGGFAPEERCGGFVSQDRPPVSPSSITIPPVGAQEPRRDVTGRRIVGS